MDNRLTCPSEAELVELLPQSGNRLTSTDTGVHADVSYKQDTSTTHSDNSFRSAKNNNPPYLYHRRNFGVGRHPSVVRNSESLQCRGLPQHAPIDSDGTSTQGRLMLHIVKPSCQSKALELSPSVQGSVDLRWSDSAELSTTCNHTEVKRLPQSCNSSTSSASLDNVRQEIPIMNNIPPHLVDIVRAKHKMSRSIIHHHSSSSNVRADHISLSQSDDINITRPTNSSESTDLPIVTGKMILSLSDSDIVYTQNNTVSSFDNPVISNSYTPISSSTLEKSDHPESTESFSPQIHCDSDLLLLGEDQDKGSKALTSKVKGDREVSQDEKHTIGSPMSVITSESSNIEGRIYPAQNQPVFGGSMELPDTIVRDLKTVDTHGIVPIPGLKVQEPGIAPSPQDPVIKFYDSSGTPVIMKIVSRSTPPPDRHHNSSPETLPGPTGSSSDYQHNGSWVSNSDPHNGSWATAPDVVSPTHLSINNHGAHSIGVSGTYNEKFESFDVHNSDEEYDSDENGNVFQVERTRLFREDSDSFGKHYGKSSEKSIMTDLSDFDLTDDIKIKADEIFRSMKIPTRRGRRRRKVVFYCVFQAYKETGLPKDPKELALKMGIDPNEISKAFSMCSETETGYRPEPRKSTPLEFIPIYYPFTGLTDDGMSKVRALTREILEKDSDLSDQFPQTVAAAILIYYMNINGVQYDKTFAQKVGKSDVTLTTMAKRVAIAHNT